jgi:hypothetical protein
MKLPKTVYRQIKDLIETSKSELEAAIALHAAGANFQLVEHKLNNASILEDLAYVLLKELASTKRVLKKQYGLDRRLH